MPKGGKPYPPGHPKSPKFEGPKNLPIKIKPSKPKKGSKGA